MTYARVIPRDLFNEGNLLKCLGALWVVLDDNRGHDAELDHDEGQPFDIEQDPSDGSLSVTNVVLRVAGQPVRLTRPMNSRDPYPLYAQFDDEAVAVFDDNGILTREFEQRIAMLPPSKDEDDSYPPPCTNPGGHEWPTVEEHERCLCVHCGADGDA